MNGKPLKFCGTSLDDLRSFPATARRRAGLALSLVQAGEDPPDWKPMTAIGRGAREIRVRDDKEAFRVIYAAKFEDAIYVLHCFGKKSQKTARGDLELATRRYKDLVKEFGK